MNLVQKLPAGLSLACVLLMSSCSNDNLQTPEPENAKAKTEANMRDISPLSPQILYPAELATTNGPAGKEKFMEFWQRDSSVICSDVQKFSAGTSKLTSLYGNSAMPFVKPLPPIPGVTGMRGVLTLSTNTFVSGYVPNVSNAKSVVKSTIKNLIPGKKYEITFYVACAVPLKTEQGDTPSLTEQVVVKLRYNASGKTQFSGDHYTDMAGKHAQWVTRKIYFTAEDTEVDFVASASTKFSGQTSYVHIYVDKNAIKKVNF